MAKSLRSKIKRRYRKVKRQHIDETLINKRVEESYAKIKKLQQGLKVDLVPPKNAFLHPNDPEAQFPQRQLTATIDFRSEALPLSGYAASGCRRQFTDEEKLKLGLVLRSMDGPLEIEKCQQQEEQLRMCRDVELPADVMELCTAAVDQQSDDASMIHSLADQLSQFKTATASETPAENVNELHLEELRCHQQRIGGRLNKKTTIPTVTNKLTTKRVKA